MENGLVTFGSIIGRARHCAAFASLIVLIGCQTTDTSSNPTTKKNTAECIVIDEAGFASAAAELTRLHDSDRGNQRWKIEFSRCGYLQRTAASGFAIRSPYSALYAKVGSPTWHIAIASRNKTERSSSFGTFKPSRYPDEAIFESPTPSRKTASRADLNRFNAIIARLARSATGERPIGVDVEQEMQGIAALNRASARIRGAALGAAAVVASSPSGDGSASAPVSPQPVTAQSQSSKRAEASVSGYLITETIAYGPSQTVVARGRCNNGKSFNVRHYPNNGKKYAIYNLFGSSLADVASRFCR